MAPLHTRTHTRYNQGVVLAALSHLAAASNETTAGQLLSVATRIANATLQSLTTAAGVLVEPCGQSCNEVPLLPLLAPSFHHDPPLLPPPPAPPLCSPGPASLQGHLYTLPTRADVKPQAARRRSGRVRGVAAPERGQRARGRPHRGGVVSAVLCCAVLCCAVLCCGCAVLCCAVLCCAVLCCAVLCCVLCWAGLCGCCPVLPPICSLACPVPCVLPAYRRWRRRPAGRECHSLLAGRRQRQPVHLHPGQGAPHSVPNPQGHVRCAQRRWQQQQQQQ